MRDIGHRRLRGASFTTGTTISGVRTMDMNDTSSEPRTAATAKKPYEKPSFRCEKVFVTTALSCGKVNPTDAACRGINNKSS